MSLLLIRADAGAGVGAGHFMRTLALAEAWVRRGGRAVMLSRCESAGLRTRAEARGVEVLPLQAEAGSDADLETTLAALEREAAGGDACLCLDSYNLGPEYQRRARDTRRLLLVVDDIAHQSEYHADLLLNQNLDAEGLAYRVDPDTTLLLGPRYALLRQEFVTLSDDAGKGADGARRVLVTLGGADPQNVTLRVIRALQRSEHSSLEVRVVVGGSNPHQAVLDRAVAEPAPNGAAFRLVRDAEDMPGLMRWADLAISAGGSTCWELCRVGVPALLLVVADNQQGIASALDRAGAAVSLGWFEGHTDESLTRAIDALAGDRARRERMAAAGRSLVDGCGAARVAEILENMIGKA